MENQVRGLTDRIKSNKYFKHILRSAAVSFVTLLFFTGCSGEKDYNETTVNIDSKGVITHEIVEAFDKDYYDEEELRDVISDEIDEYLAGKEDDSVKLSTLQIKDGMARAEIRFASYKDYSGFNDVDFFYGTIQEAMDLDYPTDVTLKSAVDDSTISRFEFEAMKKSMIVIVSEPVIMNVPKKIAYTTANINVIDDKCARMDSDSVGVGYIVLK